MTTVLAHTSPSFRVRQLRVSRMLTRQELANRAGVLVDEVNLLEEGLPVRLDVKRKLLRELWARKLIRETGY